MTYRVYRTDRPSHSRVFWTRDEDTVYEANSFEDAIRQDLVHRPLRGGGETIIGVNMSGGAALFDVTQDLVFDRRVG